jgi:hypothetical protein
VGSDPWSWFRVVARCAAGLYWCVCVCLCCVVVFVLLQVLILFVLTAMKHISPAFSRNKSYYLSGSCHIKYYYLFECNHGVMSPVVIHVCFFDNVVSLCTTFCLL